MFLNIAKYGGNNKNNQFTVTRLEPYHNWKLSQFNNVQYCMTCNCRLVPPGTEHQSCCSDQTW